MTPDAEVTIAIGSAPAVGKKLVVVAAGVAIHGERSISNPQPPGEEES
jgi:hypothetical protein